MYCNLGMNEWTGQIQFGGLFVYVSSEKNR